MTHSKRLFLAAILAGAGTVAIAQAPGPMTPTPAAAGEWTQRMTERHAQRMADLKAKLNITPAQEAAWNDYTTAMQPPADAMRPRMKNRDEFAQLTTPERIDRMQEFSAERQQRMQQRGDAVKAFYAQLTPEQQQIYDQQGMRGGRGGKRGGGHGMGHGGYGMGGGWR